MRRISFYYYRFRKLLTRKIVEQYWHETYIPAINAAIAILLFVLTSVVLYDFGFRPFWKAAPGVDYWLRIVLNLLAVLITIRLFLELFLPKKKWARILSIVSWLFIMGITFLVLPAKAGHPSPFSNEFVFLKLFLYGSIILGFIAESAYFLQLIYKRSVNPGVLFIGSFAFLIVFGAFLLKLPNATHRGISVMDALFTATSAVCVTGLVVVDTATEFTTFGHLTLMLLIQIGGLGIMTFAGLLAYAVAGRSTLKSQLAIREMMSSRQVTGIMRFVYQVVILTFVFELIGAAGIYLAMDDGLFERKLDLVFFSLFHSVSAFCNAGFSTYSGGLYEPVIRFNYPLQLVIAFLIIMGGMGFPIVINIFRFLKIKGANLWNKIWFKSGRYHVPRVININTLLASMVSVILLVIGFFLYLLFEQNATLATHQSFFGKLVVSFFGSVTPRTAGFNSVDMTTLSMPTTLVYLLLMWIGTSPGSMGGGIRTTTAGLALMNVFSVIRGKDRTEFFGFEISHQSVRRGFAVIFLSIMVISLATLLISINDGEKGLLVIAFEAVSAFSTVGLSLNATPLMSTTSRLVLIFTMFIGRVGMLTMLVAFVRQSKPLHYRYPREEIVF